MNEYHVCIYILSHHNVCHDWYIRLIDSCMNIWCVESGFEPAISHFATLTLKCVFLATKLIWSKKNWSTIYSPKKILYRFLLTSLGKMVLTCFSSSRICTYLCLLSTQAVEINSVQLELKISDTNAQSLQPNNRQKKTPKIMLHKSAPLTLQARKLCWMQFSLHVTKTAYIELICDACGLYLGCLSSS